MIWDIPTLVICWLDWSDLSPCSILNMASVNSLYLLKHCKYFLLLALISQAPEVDCMASYPIKMSLAITSSDSRTFCLFQKCFAPWFSLLLDLANLYLLNFWQGFLRTLLRICYSLCQNDLPISLNLIPWKQFSLIISFLSNHVFHPHTRQYNVHS